LVDAIRDNGVGDSANESEASLETTSSFGDVTASVFPSNVTVGLDAVFAKAGGVNARPETTKEAARMTLVDRARLFFFRFPSGLVMMPPKYALPDIAQP
jgi:hypothetical protein